MGQTLSRRPGLVRDLIKQAGGTASRPALGRPDLCPATGDAKGNEAASTSVADLISEEERTLGSVSWRIYLHYASMMGGAIGAFGLFLLLVGSQICRVGTTVLLGLWTERSISGWRLGHYIGLYGGMLGFQARVTKGQALASGRPCLHGLQRLP